MVTYDVEYEGKESKEPERPFKFKSTKKQALLLSSSTRTAKPKPEPKVPKAGAFKKQPIAPTIFRARYTRGDLPCIILHGGGQGMNRVAWKRDILSLDYQQVLPMFFEGLREKEEPYHTLAVRGTQDLISKDNGERVLSVLQSLIMPLKRALNTKDKQVVSISLQVIQQMIICDCTGKVGKAMLPHYRQLLPTMNLFKNQSKSTYDQIDYGQRKNEDIGALVNETLALLEKNGGPDAYVNIRYMIPTYESAL